MDSLIKTAKTQFFLSFAMLENLIEQCPDEVWDIKAGGFVFWQQLLHALTGTDFWMRQPEGGFSEPFSDRKVYPELDHVPEGRITKDEMIELKNTVKTLCEGFFEGRDDGWITQPSWIYDKISNLDVVFGQIRHIQYHVGHCDGILRERGLAAGEWLDWYGEG